MKILKKASDEKWWSGTTVACKCGFEGLLDGSEDIDNGQFMTIGYEIRFTCNCGRETYLEPED